MARIGTLASLSVAALSSLWIGSSVLGADAATQPTSPADALLAEIQNQKPPEVDESKRNDPQYVQTYIASARDFEQTHIALIKKFYEKYPDNAQAIPLMVDRWTSLAERGEERAVLDETADALPHAKDDAARANIAFAQALAPLVVGDTAKSGPAVEAFLTNYPKDDRGADLLQATAQREQDPPKRDAITARIIKLYPDSEVGKMAKGQQRQAAGIGKPFELSFTDAISGKPISVQRDFAGKVVVVDFWATWCGPCVAMMPDNKALYGKYHDKGVEFVGVSLDQPDDGLKALKDFVSKNQIPWPQDYQGKGWDSDFSSSWGIDAIPCVFTIDKHGNLHSTSASGDLETQIKDLIAAD